MSNIVTIDNITIRQDSEGRFCLNDLHQAAGGFPKDKPAEFMRLTSTWDLIREVEETVGNPTFSSVSTTPGRNGGTYVCKELVYAYAMWISPTFHLKVIRAYDRLATQGIAVHEKAALDFLKNPLPFMEIVMAQAKEFQARAEIAEPKAAVFDKIVADKRMTVAAYAKTLHGLNTNALKGDLKRLGYLYTDHAGRYRVLSKYRDTYFAERVVESYGNFDIFVLDKGKVLISTLYDEGRLTMKKAFIDA